MENRPLDHEEQDASTEETSSKKKRGGSRLSQFLSGIRSKEKDASIEKETSDEKPKRFRRLFNKLFPRVVENPNSEENERQHQFDPESWFSWMRPIEVEATTSSEDPPELKDDSVETDLRSSETPAEASGPEGPSEQLDALPEVSEDISEAAELPHPQNPIEVPAQAVEQELYIREHPPVETIPEVAKPTDAVAMERPQKETVIERGPGMVLPVALVGLEHLGRKKADKKLEKRVNEKISDTNKEVTRNTALQQELETLTRQNQEQLEALKRARAKEALDLSRAAEHTQQPQLEKAVPAPETPKPSALETQVKPIQKVEQPRREEVKPEKILEQVADAAEHNIAVERVFERSHEVKDDQVMPGAAASVGSVVADRASTLPPRNAPPVFQSPVIHNLPSQVVNEKEAAEIYKQAIKTGFWAAIAIIILGSLAYLVIQ